MNVYWTMLHEKQHKSSATQQSDFLTRPGVPPRHCPCPHCGKHPGSCPPLRSLGWKTPHPAENHRIRDRSRKAIIQVPEPHPKISACASLLPLGRGVASVRVWSWTSWSFDGSSYLSPAAPNWPTHSVNMNWEQESQVFLIWMSPREIKTVKFQSQSYSLVYWNLLVLVFYKEFLSGAILARGHLEEKNGLFWFTQLN